MVKSDPIVDSIDEVAKIEDEKVIERVHVLQSFSPYVQRFKTSYGEIVLPAGSDKDNKNIIKQANYEIVGNLLIVNDGVYAQLMEVTVFRHLTMSTSKRKPLIRELEKVPDGYISADKIAALARQETEKVKAEMGNLEDELAIMKKKNLELEKKLSSLGGEA